MKLRIEQELEVVDRYTKGETSGELAKSLGICQQTVYNILHRLGRSRTKKHRKAHIARKIVQICAAGATIAEAAIHVGVSESTVDRVFRKYRAEGIEIRIKRGRPQRTKLPPSDFRQRSKTKPAFVDPEQINEVYNRLRQIPFPYPDAEEEWFTKDIQSLRSLQTRVDSSNVIQPRSPVGVRICAPFFPNRYRAIWKSNASAFDGWNDEKILKKAIRFQLLQGDPVMPRNVLRAVTLACRTPTIFRPGVARFIYKRFCQSGGRVWDPCSGYGGRLLGAFAADVDYIGTDVDVETVEGNRRLAEKLGARYEIFVTPAECFDPPTVDLVFTSPPYFDRERYSHDKNQTWKKYGANLETWLTGFLRPVVERARAALRVGGHLILNVADLKERGNVIPIVSKTTEIAIESGFSHVKTLRMPLAAINRVSPTEPVLIFQKS